jgi:hypothetical protein
LTWGDIPEGTVCVRCGKHPATRAWFGDSSAMGFIHMEGEPWCECCTLNAQIAYALERAAALPGLRKDLESACGGEPLPDVQDLLTENRQLRNEGYHQWLAAHSQLCGQHYPGQDALNYAHPHPPGEHCYWPEPAA